MVSRLAAGGGSEPSVPPQKTSFFTLSKRTMTSSVGSQPPTARKSARRKNMAWSPNSSRTPRRKHADTLLPDDAVAVMRRVLADPGTALAGFTPLLSGPDRVRWGTSFHNWIKTWYAALLFRPQLAARR
jgi:hypothetical protein